MNIIKLTRFDTANGVGIRDVIWVSGCEHHCLHCHNPQTWDKTVGTDITEFDFSLLWSDLKKPYVKGVTFSGGDPLATYNRQYTITMATWIRLLFPDKDIWCYTGYLWEEVKDIPELGVFDVLVDGEYQESNRNIMLPWCGSSNQRVIDVRKSLDTHSIVLY